MALDVYENGVQRQEGEVKCHLSGHGNSSHFHVTALCEALPWKDTYILAQFKSYAPETDPTHTVCQLLCSLLLDI